jgi:hypothetical protein
VNRARARAIYGCVLPPQAAAWDWPPASQDVRSAVAPHPGGERPRRWPRLAMDGASDAAITVAVNMALAADKKLSV